MTTETEDDVLCRICRQTQRWHEEHRPRHTFVHPDNPGGLAQLGSSNRDRREAQGQSNVKVLRGLPSDPAVRILLLRKGLITQDELNEVEREIRQAQESGSIVVVSPQTDPGESGDRPDHRLGNASSA